MEAVLLNPYQYYAEAFIGLLYEQHGIRTIALHTDWRTRLIRQPRMPILDSPAVVAHYMVPSEGVLGLVPVLRRRHRVGAVLPHDEGAVVPLVELGKALGVSWAEQPVLACAGSKADLKRFIAAADPSVRLNAVTRVAGTDEVVRWAHEHDIARFVLKPDAGSGNRGVAFFDAAPCDLQALDDYFAQHRGPTLAEEFIGGSEFWVNGQTGPDGRPVVTGLGRYERRTVNGKENVEVGCRSLPTTDDVSAALSDYAVAVLTAMGLSRSPFHLEAKVDGRGPCLIEVGMRLCGEKLVVMDGWAHGTDLVAAAVDGYAREDGGEVSRVNWDRYDTHRFVAINGTSTRHDRVAEVRGVAAVEQLPGFQMWIKEPEVGDTVVPTRDLLANPWSVYFGGRDDAALDQAETDVRAVLDIVGLSDAPGGARWAVYRERIARYWRARPRLSLIRSRRARRSR